MEKEKEGEEKKKKEVNRKGATNASIKILSVIERDVLLALRHS